MKNKVLIGILIIWALTATAYAATDYFRQYSFLCSTEAQDAAINTEMPLIPLSQEEEALFRLGFAFGYDKANETTSPLRSVQTEPTYIVNLATKKFHIPSCYMVNSILFENREDLYCTYEEALLQGYSPCGKCNPK